VLSLLEEQLADAFFWQFLKPLLLYQAFILLPILGVGGFILPRFFNLPSRQNLPESRQPFPEWNRQAAIASAVGLVVLVSFFIEAAGYNRAGPLIRLAAATFYLYWQVPIHRTPIRSPSAELSLKAGLILLPAGLLAIGVFPGFRVSLLHLTLAGGFGIITLVVAMRVIYGHSGNLSRLKGRQRWLTIVLGLMLLGVATRISGDFWPRVLASHYSYGAVLWGAGLVLWAVYVLPLVTKPDPDE
jgi:hypothetical protein